MYSLDRPAIGIYEKALPKDLDWRARLLAAKNAGFDFVEMSVDETDMRLSRLDWTSSERLEFVKAVMDTGIRVPSMCLSGHRRFPLGSEDPVVREKALTLMKKAIEFAVDTGIRNIQLAGYDVYYTPGNARTRALFVDGLRQAVAWAAKAEVMLSMEIMDYPLMNSISRYLYFAEMIRSPWFTVYPDIGNLTAWGSDVEDEFTKGFEKISAIHLKDTLAVTGEFPGKFKEIPFGEGCVDFTEFFRVLGRLGYTGPFLIEMWTEKAADPIAETVKAKDWLLERMREAGYKMA